MSAPVMPLWVDSYLAATTDLTATEHGAYLLLLMAAWKNDGRLPNDDKKLARIARVTSGQWARIKDEILSFWDVEGDFITQSRLTKELGAVKRKSASASNSARSRWLKTNKVDDANASDPQCYPKPEPNKLSSKAPPNPQRGHREGGRAKRNANPLYTPAFEAAWLLWKNEFELDPGGKGDAAKAWSKRSDSERSRFAEAAAKYAHEVARKQRARRDGDPWNGCALSTFLNGGRIDTYTEDQPDGQRSIRDEQRGADAPRAEDGAAGHDERVLRGGEGVRGVPGGDGAVECAEPGGRGAIGGLGGLPAPLGAVRAEPHHIRAGGVERPRRDGVDANPLALGDDGHSGGRPAWVH